MFITLVEATKPMVTDAVKEGFYETMYSKFPRVQATNKGQNTNLIVGSYPASLPQVTTVRKAHRGAVAAVILAGVFHLAGIRVNASASLPIGLYRTTSDPSANLVEFCPAEPFASLSATRGYRGTGNCRDGAEPLMKPIVAIPGDEVDLSAHGVSVNCRLLPNSAPRSADTKGRPLAHWPFGKYRVSSGTVWVISSYNPRSFDSRYLGAVSVDSIRHRLRPLLIE